MNDPLNAFTGLVRRCVDDYAMIEAGDRIAVGVSGGKDSLVLLCALNHLRSYYPKPFELEGITLELGFEGMDFSPVAALCERLGIPYTAIRTDIKEIVFDVRQEDNPCSLCAKMRRGALNNAMKERGCSKLALGHHFDDAVETFLMSLLLEGRISCFKPKTWMSRAGVWQIRPMLYAGEQSGSPRSRKRLRCRSWKTPVRRTRPASAMRSSLSSGRSPRTTPTSRARYSARCSARPSTAGK